MRRIALGFAVLLVAGAAAFAAAPAKTMDTAAGKVWTDDKGMTLYTFDKDEKGKRRRRTRAPAREPCGSTWRRCSLRRHPMASARL
jgi:predicted lipoprotein with Yx(FWY)xxD motif